MDVKMNGYVIRAIEAQVREDLGHKMVFIGGPRQTGKTTLAKHLGKEHPFLPCRYLSWDVAADRRMVMEETFPKEKGLLILDEVHKYSRWRQTVKGLFDTRAEGQQILVTGSARLDMYRRGGDSLQGRYHFHRLFPFTLGELSASTPDGVRDLMALGGFPEPFLGASETGARRWSREYQSRILREDLRDLERVVDVSLVERLAQRLPELVGAPLSLNGLREDLEVAHTTVARWVQMLENLYMLFRVHPFGAPKLRAVKKEAKHYHYDWTLVPERGKRFENMVALHLWRWCCHYQDCEGRDLELRFFRDTDRREVDFVVTEKNRPILFVECKTSDEVPTSALHYLKERFPKVRAVQVSLDGSRDAETREGIRLCPAHVFLGELKNEG